MTVWKFTIPITDYPTVRMPEGARIIHVGQQGFSLCVWAVVDPLGPQPYRRFRLLGTGHHAEPGETEKHVGTFMPNDGEIVFHLFDLGE